MQAAVLFSIRHRMEKAQGKRLPDSVHRSGPWRIGEIVPDFTLEDVWALPARGGPDEFQDLLRLLASSNPAEADSLPTRFLWQLRDKLGNWLDLGRISTSAERSGSGGLPIPGTGETSLEERLPEDLRDTAPDYRFGALPFKPLYMTGDEFAAEVSNRTVHGVMHLAWADRGDGAYEGQMAVYVKPRGAFGKGYMELIKPFRYWIVYPALMRQTERTWNARPR